MLVSWMLWGTPAAKFYLSKLCDVKFVNVLSVPKYSSAKSETRSSWNPSLRRVIKLFLVSSKIRLCIAFVRSSKTVSSCLEWFCFNMATRKYKTCSTYLLDPYMSLSFPKNAKVKVPPPKFGKKASKSTKHKTNTGLFHEPPD